MNEWEIAKEIDEHTEKWIKEHSITKKYYKEEYVEGLKSQLNDIREYVKEKLSTYPDNLTNEMMEQRWLKDILSIIERNYNNEHR